eukprot:403360305
MKKPETQTQIPENASKLINILTNANLQTKSEEQISAYDALKNSKAVGLYFSMHSCPPCRQFTPKLAEYYNEVNAGAKANEKPFEVIFVSCDQDKKVFDSYYKEMPWLALPFQDSRIRALSQQYQVRTVPRLVILNQNGDSVYENAVQKVTNEGAKALQEFIEGKHFSPQQLNQMGGSNQKQSQAAEVNMDSLKSQVNEVIQSTPVVVFSKTYCPYCVEAKNILKKGNVQFLARELDNEDDGAETQDALKQLTGQSTVPNIFIGGNHVGGCSDLKSKLKSGEVKNLLEAAGVPHGF